MKILSSLVRVVPILPSCRKFHCSDIPVIVGREEMFCLLVYFVVVHV